MIRGVRGAICAAENTHGAIFDATSQLLKQMIERNEINPEMVASIFLTATVDLDADFPAYAVRECGYALIPVMCAVEINVPGAMKKVIRILIHYETEKKQNEIKHVYLGKASSLRPDLTGEDR